MKPQFYSILYVTFSQDQLSEIKLYIKKQKKHLLSITAAWESALITQHPLEQIPASGLKILSNTPSNEPLANTARQHICAPGPWNEVKRSNCLELAVRGRPPSHYSVEKIRAPLTLLQKSAFTQNEKIELLRRPWKCSYYVTVLPSTPSNFLLTFLWRQRELCGQPARALCPPLIQRGEVIKIQVPSAPPHGGQV